MKSNDKTFELSIVEPVGSKEERTVFLSNMSYNTTAEAVFQLLSAVSVAIRI